MPETDFTFTNTSEDAYRETVNRNVAGARLSARLWNLSNGNARNINDVVQGSIRVGQSVTAAGKALLSVSPDVAMVKIPQYIQELKNAADRARALSDNSILQNTIKKYESYINKLTRGVELTQLEKQYERIVGSLSPTENKRWLTKIESAKYVQARYAHLGIRGASRMFVKRLQSNTQEVFDSAVDKWVGRKASYQARVVARNETNEAHWLAGQKVAEDKPYVTGFKWNLGSHPKFDICDSYAGKIFAKGEVPARPHPNCNCWLSQEFDDDYFKNYTPSPELMQQVRDDPRFPEFKSWAMGWLEKTGAGFVAPAIAPAIAPEAVMPEWKPAQTIEDAKNWAKGRGFDLSNIEDVQVVNDYLEAFNEAGINNLAKLNGWERQAGKVGSYKVDKYGNIIKWEITLPKDGLKYIPKITDTIDFIPNSLKNFYDKDLNYKMDMIERKILKGSSITNSKDLAMHELGHIKTAEMRLPKGLSGWDVVENKYMEWVEKTPTIFSGYACKNYTEGLAEAFVEYKRGTYKRGMLPKFLEEEFLNIIK